jgi:hypothetical protein
MSADPVSFTDVLIKFFTNRRRYENKGATAAEVAMTRELKSVLIRTRGTLVEDAAGVIALVAMLFVGLHLPSFF